jgi:hypothetical protein
MSGGGEGISRRFDQVFEDADVFDFRKLDSKASSSSAGHRQRSR